MQRPRRRDACRPTSLAGSVPPVCFACSFRRSSAATQWTRSPRTRSSPSSRRADAVDRLDVDDPEHHVLQLVARTRGSRSPNPRDRTIVGHGGDVRTHRPDGAGRGRHGQADRPVSVQQRQPARVVVLPRRFVTGASGTPEWRFLFLPKSDVEILDTWRVAGLRGTASHDVLVDGVLVPLERTASPISIGPRTTNRTIGGRSSRCSAR